MNTDIIEIPEQPLAPSPTVESMLTLAIERGANVETLERLMAIRREVKAEQAKEAFDKALSDFQMECPPIHKGRDVMNKDKLSIRYRYAGLDDIISQVKSLLQKHGFSYTTDATVEEGWVTAICRVTHSLGHSQTSSFKVPISKDAYMSDPQKFAASLTFAKRYAFCNGFGIITSDEDREPAVPNEQPESDPAAPKVQPRAERPTHPLAKAVNKLCADWKARFGSEKSTPADFKTWAMKSLKTDKDLGKLDNWSVDAIDSLTEDLK